MTTRLEKAGTFRELAVANRTLRRISGDVRPAIGARPTVTNESFLTHNRAVAAAERQIAALRAQGWIEPGLGQDPTERDLTLEAAIRASRPNRDDTGAYVVYADWLQERHHPIGELIALELANDPQHRDRIADLHRDFGPQHGEIVEVGWRNGFWSSLSLANLTGIDRDPFPDVKRIFSRFSCAVLDHLAIGEPGIDLEDARRDVPAIIELAEHHAWARHLRSLVVAADDQIDLAHWVAGDIGGAISNVFPGLETLAIRSGDMHGAHLASANFDLPALRSFKLETCSLSRTHLANLIAGKLPRLTALELWFGSEPYGADCELADLAPILTGAAWPNLTELGLCNFEHADQLARVIHRSALAPQLVKLDLSKGTLDEAAAAELATNRASFPALKILDVSYSYLSPAALAQLRAAFAGIEVTAEYLREDRPVRYVAFGE